MAESCESTARGCVPDTPASLICEQNLSIPLLMMGLKYVNITSGADRLGEVLRTMLMTASSVVPFCRARVAAV